MKTIKHIICIVMSVLLCQACEIEITDYPQNEPKLFLQCCPGPQDTTVIQLYRTIPIGTRYEGSPYLSDANLQVKVNGEIQRVEYADKWVGSVPTGCWFVPNGMKENDVVEIEAYLERVESIYASTLVPAEVPDFQYKLSEGRAGVSLHAGVSFIDDYQENSWYGLAVVCERTVSQNDSNYVETGHLLPFDMATGTTGMAINTDWLDMGFNGWAFGGRRSVVRIWSSDLFENGEVHLSMDLGDAFWLKLFWGKYDEIRRYKVRVYRFPEEFYKYVVSLNNKHDRYADYGFLRTNISYSNVAGGFGILSGWNVKETDWIYPEKY
ncbi:MAG: DUF4249 family protein [Bacteroidales bacterium]|jgi:hypothetical protein|nr:DUF4249 family protein [Bacteroidales bacterium]